jgi:hypothetical protein
MNNKLRTVDLKTLRNVTGGAGASNWDWNKSAPAPTQNWTSNSGSQSWWKA